MSTKFSKKLMQKRNPLYLVVDKIVLLLWIIGK
jgi:hypothetical protein